MATIDAQPTYFRADKAEGVSGRVDPKGGYRGAGVIHDVAVITRGEALGHGVWIDQEFLRETADAINVGNKGVKSRFTHPSMSGDGLGRFVGRVMNARVEGDKVLADQHFSEAGHSTPDGDLAKYLMDLAKSDPDVYGLSIVFAEDHEAIDESIPDPDNVKALQHVRLKTLRAVDAVDEPAANPDGLFHRGNATLDDAEALAAFAVGLSQTKPLENSLGLDPDRVKGFLSRFLDANELSITKKEKTMRLNAQTEADNPIVGESTIVEAETVVTDNPIVEGKPQEPEAPAEPEAPVEPAAPAESLKTGRDFIAEFGTQGAVWFAEGKSYEDASALYVAKLREENESLKLRLAASGEGETDPVTFESETDPPKGKGFASHLAKINTKK